jgi:RNA polymerase sigma-70 factor (ECF subfamily)
MNGEIDFRKIYQEFQPKIHRYLSRLLGPYAAEDTVQEVFEKVHRSLDGFKEKSTLSTWLYRIATNTALDKFRSSSFKHSSACSPLEESTAIENQNLWTGQQDSPLEQKVVRKEMSECVREYIDNLSPDYKAVLILSEIEGFRNKEITAILQISLENVKIRLHRARAGLKKELNDGCDFYHNEQGTLACDRKPILIQVKKSD